MSHRNNRMSGINDSNRRNKYSHTNKWKNSNWGRNYRNYGNGNYNSDYGYDPDFRFDSGWNPNPNPSIRDNDWYGNQHSNFAHNYNINSGTGINFASRPNRTKQNLSEKIDRRTDSCQIAPPKQTDAFNHNQIDKKFEKCTQDPPSTITSSSSNYNSNNYNSGNGINVASRFNRNISFSEKIDRRIDTCQIAPSKHADAFNHNQIEKKFEKCTKDTPSTITSSSDSQPCSSNSIEKSSDSNILRQQTEHSAEQVTKKLIHQLTSMNKHNLKQMINNPSSKYETALQTHARNRLRAEMRTKLQNMSSNQEQQLLNNVLDTEESVDMDKIPDNVFDEIGRVLDINLLGQEGNSSKKYYDNDKDKEQIAYPEDLFLRAEKLLMENSILFLEDRMINDSILNVTNDRLDDDRTSIKIKNEIKEEVEDVSETDDNFLEIQERVNENYLLNDLVFEDRVGSLSPQNFVDQLSAVSQTHQIETATENSEESVASPKPILITNIRTEKYTDTDYNVNSSSSVNTAHSMEMSNESPLELSKTADTQRRPIESKKNTLRHSHRSNADGADRSKSPKSNLSKESHHEHQIAMPSGSTISPVVINTEQETPKKINLFTKLQNSGAFNSTSTRKKTDAKMLEREDNKRVYKKKKKHKSRSRSTSRIRSSRSKSRSRSSHTKESKKRSPYDNSCRKAAQNILEPRNVNEVNESQPNTLPALDEKIDEFVEIVKEAAEQQDVVEQEVPLLVEQEEHENEVTESKVSELEVHQGAINENENVTNTMQQIVDNQNENDAIQAICSELPPKDVSTDVIEQTSVSDHVDPPKTGDEQNISTELKQIPVHENIVTDTVSISHVTVTDTVSISHITLSDNMNEIKESEEKNEISNTLKETQEAVSVGDESCTSIGSNLAEIISVTQTSESQSSVPDDNADVVPANSSPWQSNNEISVKKIEAKTSSGSRHQRNQQSSSRHKCEKEKHSSSSSKNKKLSTSSTKKSDHKDNSSVSTTNTSVKHSSSHSETSQRVWRSAGEKKCIESTPKVVLRNVDLFEQPKVIETKTSSRKEIGKTHTVRPNKLTPNPSQPKLEVRKSSITSNKKLSTTPVKEKTSQNPSVASEKPSSNIDPVAESQPHLTPLLSNSIKIASNNTGVLEQMKEIDIKVMELQLKKTFIDEQIHNLHKEKNVIDQTIIQLQNERFLLLSSLFPTNATVNVTNTMNTFNESGKKKVCEAPLSPSSELEKNLDNKINSIASDDDSNVVKKSISKKGKLPKTLKRTIQEDDTVDSYDAGKCKKRRINLNQIKSSSNTKSKLKTEYDDEPQCDLKSKHANSVTRFCSVRLTRFSSKKIKLMTGKEMSGDECGDFIEPAKSTKSSPSQLDNKHGTLFDGTFSGHRLPIVHLQVIEGFLVAASEDSNIYKHDMQSGKLLETFSEHAKTVSNFIATDNNSLYSVSLDGCLKKFCLKNFDKQLLSVYIGEPLQVMEYSWDTVFIGSRSGRIYLFDTKMDTLAEECLCSVGKSIMALKATKEGPRKIIIASSRCHNIHVRDATSGLLLRTIEVPDKLTIYSIHLNGGHLYCGTNKNLVFRYEFTSGNEISRIKLGTGTICLKTYKNSIILGGCYDGYIYAYDTKNEIQLNRFPGPGKMLLHFDVYGDKIIAASKDKSLRVLDIPDDIVLHEQ